MTVVEFLDKIKETLTEKNIRVTMNSSEGGSYIYIEKIIPCEVGSFLVLNCKNNKIDNIRVIPVAGEPVSHITDSLYPYKRNNIIIHLSRNVGYDLTLEMLLPYLTSSHLKLWDEDFDKEYKELLLLAQRYKKRFEE